MTESQNRCCKEAHGQRSQDDLQHGGRRRILRPRRKRPRLVKKNVRQKEKGLKNGKKADEARSYSHVPLDSRNDQKGICEFTGHDGRSATRNRPAGMKGFVPAFMPLWIA